MPLTRRLERLGNVLMGTGWKTSGETMLEASKEITELTEEMQRALDERNEFKDALAKLWKLFQPIDKVPDAETAKAQIDEDNRTIVLVTELLGLRTEIPDEH